MKTIILHIELDCSESIKNRDLLDETVRKVTNALVNEVNSGDGLMPNDCGYTKRILVRGDNGTEIEINDPCGRKSERVYIPKRM